MKHNAIAYAFSLIAFGYTMLGASAAFVGCRPPQAPTQQMTITMAGYEGSLDQCIVAADRLDAGKYDAYTACADEVDIRFGLSPRSSK